MNQPLKGIKVVYVTTSPTNQPRLEKIRTSLTRNGASFHIFRPKLTVRLLNRRLNAVLNYGLFLLQAPWMNADVMWVSNCPDITALPYALTRRRYVYDFRSPWSKELEIEFGRGLFFRLSELVEKIARRYASVFVVVSRRMVSDLSSYKKPLFVVPNYPFREFSSNIERNKFRKMMNVQDNEKVAVFVGRLTKIEGVDLLEDVADALSMIPNTRLWILGDGPLKQFVLRLTNKYPNKVTYFGWVPHADVPNYIVAADVSIMPRHDNPNSDYYSEEGVHKISESIWLGTPVIASNVAPSRYYISTDGESFAKVVVSFLTGPMVKPPSIPSWEDASEPELIRAVLKAVELKG
jgi:glycosyltransferase involved in cell wall biosynthesis